MSWVSLILLFLPLISLIFLSLPLVFTSPTEIAVESPPFCLKECPPYVLVEQHNNYEVRRYGATKWISTQYETNDTLSWNSHKLAFKKLLSYLTGNNDQGVRISMTVPVITKVTPCKSDRCVERYVKSFYIPSAYLDNIPAPNDPTVYIQDIPEITYFVRSFKGWALSLSRHQENIEQLQEDIGDRADVSFYYKACYGPSMSEAAHNEGWLMAL